MSRWCMSTVLLLAVLAAACGRRQQLPQPAVSDDPARAARELTRLGRPGEAMEKLGRLLERNPRDLSLHRWYVEAARAAGRLAAAAELYRRLAEREGIAGSVAYGRAMLAAATGPGELDRALELLGEAERLLPRVADVPYRRGLLELMASRFAAAERHLARASRLQPRQPLYRVARAEALVRLNREREAMKVLEPVLELDPAPKLLERAVTVAARVYDPLRHSDPEVVPELQQALDLLAGDNVQQALAVVNKVLERFPEDVLALTLKGLAHSRLLNHGEAVASLQRALELQPDSPAALLGLGDVYFGLERFGRARGYYERALQLNPFDAEAYQRLGELASARREHELAARAFAKLVLLQPGHLPNRYRLGWELVAAGKLDQAVAVYRGILELKPDDPEALVRLGSLHLKLAQRDPPLAEKQRARAVEYLRRAQRINPENQAVKNLLQKLEN